MGVKYGGGGGVEGRRDARVCRVNFILTGQKALYPCTPEKGYTRKLIILAFIYYCYARSTSTDEPLHLRCKETKSYSRVYVNDFFSRSKLILICIHTYT